MTKFQASREYVSQVVEHGLFQKAIMALIILNSIVLGLQTSPEIMSYIGTEINLFDEGVLVIFIIELGLRIYAKGLFFFRDPWGVFDFLVVAITLAPTNESLAVLRALRVLRVFRTISTVPRLRRIVAALLNAVPAVGAIIALLLLVFYVFSVITTTLFGQDFPVYFGTIGKSMFTLFQIMTLESWSMGIVRPIMEIYPWAWIVFVIFLIVSSFTVLNLFIAIIIDSIQTLNNNDKQKDIGDLGFYKDVLTSQQEQSLALLKTELEDLKRLIKEQSR